MLMIHRKILLWLWLFVCGLVLPGKNDAQSKPAADLIITHAKIWTVDKSLPTATYCERPSSGWPTIHIIVEFRLR
jgi:hypothetical protein